MVYIWTFPLFWLVHFKSTNHGYSAVYISNVNTATNLVIDISIYIELFKDVYKVSPQYVWHNVTKTQIYQQHVVGID